MEPSGRTFFIPGRPSVPKTPIPPSGDAPSPEVIIEMLQGVGLFADIVNFGLNTVLRPGEEKPFVKKIILVRQKFQQHFGEVLGGYFEFFDRKKFLQFSTIAANILMGSPESPEFSADSLAASPFLVSKAQLKNTLIVLGKELTARSIEILGKMPPDEVFFRQTPLLPERLEEYKEISARIDGMRLNEIDPEDALNFSIWPCASFRESIR